MVRASGCAGDGVPVTRRAGQQQQQQQLPEPDGDAAPDHHAPTTAVVWPGPGGGAWGGPVCQRPTCWFLCIYQEQVPPVCAVRVGVQS